MRPALSRFQVHKDLRQGLGYVRHPINGNYHNGTISNDKIAGADAGVSTDRRKMMDNKISPRMIRPHPGLIWPHLPSGRKSAQENYFILLGAKS